MNDLQEADRRDYATYDRLNAFRKHQEIIKEAYEKKKKLDTVKSSLKDAPA